MIYLLTAIGLTPGGSSTVHIYIHTCTIHRTTQSTQTIHRTTQLTNWQECGPCTVFASYTLQLRKKHGKTSARKKPKHGKASSIFKINAHVQLNICINSTIPDTQQARSITTYKNTKYKLLKTNAAVRYNKTCRNSQLTQKYVNIRTKVIPNKTKHKKIYFMLCNSTNETTSR